MMRFGKSISRTCGACLAVLAVGCVTPSQGSDNEVRVLISPVADTVPDDADLIAQLSAAAGASLRFAATVSPLWAAYYMQCATNDVDCEKSIARLRDSGLVRQVQRDQRKGL